MHRGRILYVEDQDSLRETVAGTLEDEGFDVATAATAEQGLRLLQLRGADLLLTDYMLPGRTGGWLARVACAAGILRPDHVVVVTGESSPEEVAGLHLLHKPVDLEELLRTVDALTRAEAPAAASV